MQTTTPRFNFRKGNEVESIKKELIKGMREACIKHNIDPDIELSFNRVGTIEQIVEEIVFFLPVKEKRPIGFHREDE